MNEVCWAHLVLGGLLVALGGSRVLHLGALVGESRAGSRGTVTQAVGRVLGGALVGLLGGTGDSLVGLVSDVVGGVPEVRLV